MDWKIGIIGAGLIADFHAKAVGDINNAKLIGFCDSGSGRAKQLAEKYSCKAYSDWENMIKSGDVNVIFVASPSGAHMEPAVLAAEKGIHVLCEKPLDITLDRIDQMIASHEKSGTYLGGIFNFRYDEAVKHIKNCMSTGRFGKISYAGVYVPWYRNRKYYADNWHGTKKLDGGGALMNQSIHMIDLLQYLMGPVKSLKSYIATIVHKIEVEDTGVASLQFKNGALGLIHGTTAAYPGQLRRLEIMGTKGTAVMVDDKITTWEFENEQPEDDKIRNLASKKSGGGAADPGAIAYINHKLNIESFLQAIETGKPFEIDGKESRKAVEIVLAIYEASEHEKEVFFSTK